jgi:DNA-binding NarL/FixJ family response regulator
MNLGASAYILKPFSKDLLLKSIRRVLPGRI